MKMLKRLSILSICISIVPLLSPNLAEAQIDGFNFLQGFTPNFADAGTSLSVGEDFVEITNGGTQGRNIFFNTRQPIDSFTASFVYQAEAIGSLPSNPGISFIIQNDPRELEAVTSSASGAGFAGIDQSFGLVFDLTGGDFSIQQNGTLTAGKTSLEGRSPFDDGLLVSLEYDGTLLDISIDDGIQPALTQTVLISPDIATTIGSGDAFVGFGGSAASLGALSSQTISNFQFTPGAAVAILGDVNQDGVVDFSDIPAFISILFSGSFLAEADIDLNGTVDLSLIHI